MSWDEKVGSERVGWDEETQRGFKDGEGLRSRGRESGGPGTRSVRSRGESGGRILEVRGVRFPA